MTKTAVLHITIKWLRKEKKLKRLINRMRWCPQKKILKLKSWPKLTWIRLLWSSFSATWFLLTFWSMWNMAVFLPAQSHYVKYSMITQLLAHLALLYMLVFWLDLLLLLQSFIIFQPSWLSLFVWSQMDWLYFYSPFSILFGSCALLGCLLGFSKCFSVYTSLYGLTCLRMRIQKQFGWHCFKLVSH